MVERSRVRRWPLSILPLVVVAGLASRRWPLPGVFAEHTGDALYAVAAYVLLALLRPRFGPLRLSALSFSFAAIVELTQLLRWPWLLQLRDTRLGALLLGQGFVAADLVAYAVGAAAAGGLHTAAGRLLRRRKSAAVAPLARSADTLPRRVDGGAASRDEPHMRNILLVGWLMLPIGAWAYHEGPGQDRLALEEVDAVLVAAHEAAANGDHRRAIKEYEAAIAKLPSKDGAVDLRLQHRLQIELNKSRMQASGLMTAREELETLVEQMQGEKESDPAQLREARQLLARSQFFTTWLMRLEGLTRDEWEPEIEAARQNWRLLAEQSPSAEEAKLHEADLEAAVRLARLEIEDLQGLPLPGE